MITRRNFLKKVGVALACVPLLGTVKPRDVDAVETYKWKSKTYHPHQKEPDYSLGSRIGEQYKKQWIVCIADEDMDAYTLTTYSDKPYHALKRTSREQAAFCVTDKSIKKGQQFLGQVYGPLGIPQGVKVHGEWAL